MFSANFLLCFTSVFRTVPKFAIIVGGSRTSFGCRTCYLIIWNANIKFFFRFLSSPIYLVLFLYQLRLVQFNNFLPVIFYRF
jgi:hypothetical protein